MGQTKPSIYSTFVSTPSAKYRHSLANTKSNNRFHFLVLYHFQIHDSSLGGSSDDDDFLGVLRGPSSFANAFLYVGLGTIAIGLVIAFVGTGEKGFKTVELRLIGPSLIGERYADTCQIDEILMLILHSHI